MTDQLSRHTYIHKKIYTQIQIHTHKYENTHKNKKNATHKHILTHTRSHLRVATLCLYTPICGIFCTNSFSSPTVLAACLSSYWVTTDLAWWESLGPTAEKLQSLISAYSSSEGLSCIVLISEKELSIGLESEPDCAANFSPGNLTVPVRVIMIKFNLFWRLSACLHLLVLPLLNF